MSLTYTTLQTALSTLTAIPTTDDNFEAILPFAIEYAEGRIYRDLDLVAATVTDGSASLGAGNRNFTLPTSVGTFLIVTAMNVISPASTAPDSGTRNPLQPVSREFLDLTWPSATGSALPQYFSLTTLSTTAGQNQVVVGPWPDAAYRVEVIGKIQPTPLSASNTTTYLSLNYPDLFLMACALYYVGPYMKNTSGASDDPKTALSFESQYQTLLKSADLWQARARFGAASWTSKQVEPNAAPQRG